MRRHTVATLMLLAVLALLAGCGKKGDLFLPTKPATTTPATASSVVRPAAPAVSGQR